MPQFNSRRSSFRSEGIDLAGNRISDSAATPPPFWSSFQGDTAATPLSDNPLFDALSPASSTPGLLRAQERRLPALPDIARTGSLVPSEENSPSLLTALQGALEQEGQIRKPLIIPGSRKRALAIAAPVPAANKKLFYPRWQLGFLLAAVTLFVSLSLFSVVPITHGQNGAAALQQTIALFAGTGSNTSAAIAAQQQAAQQAQQAQQAPVTVSSSDYVAVARAAANSCGIPEEAFVRQIQQESGFNPYAVSPAGAVGIAQFEPATAAGLGIDPWNPTQALYGAACYMARLAASFGGNYAKALAGYNAGSANVNAAVANCGAAWLSCLPPETQNYVTLIMG